MHTYWVEVTIDNSERKMPIDHDKLTIKRQYNCANDKEEFFVNESVISAKDLAHIFDAANLQS